MLFQTSLHRSIMYILAGQLQKEFYYFIDFTKFICTLASSAKGNMSANNASFPISREAIILFLGSRREVWQLPAMATLNQPQLSMVGVRSGLQPHDIWYKVRRGKSSFQPGEDSADIPIDTDSEPRPGVNNNGSTVSSRRALSQSDQGGFKEKDSLMWILKEG